MFWPYTLKEFSEKLNELKVDYDGITPMEEFARTTTYINQHTWGCTVYVLDPILKCNIDVLSKWEP